ncbi:MAG: hypothetical protein FWD16_00910 [Clostridia bacterium]|nr:hypothetical protein [Clostridia bacterium]
MTKDRPLTLYERQKIEKPSVTEVAAEHLDAVLYQQLSDFVEFLTLNKMTPRIHTTNTFKVTYKGRQVLKIPIAYVTYKNKNCYSIVVDTAEVEDMDRYLEPLDDDMRAFYFENIRLCRHCSKCPPKSMTVLGRKINNYCGTYMQIFTPTQQQYEYIKRFIMLRRDYLASISP